LVPLDPDDLQRVLTADLSQARTLPAAAYLSDDVFRWEKEHYFDGGWVAVGRSSLIANSGDQAAVEVGNRGVLLTRDRHGQAHAFLNACPHRGHELLPAGANNNRSGIRCPYHSWVFGLDGCLLKATHFGDTEGFDAQQWPLAPLRTAEWAGWVFINANGDAPDFIEFLGDLNDILAPWLAVEWTEGSSRTYECQTNWKLIAENYLECYHCPSIHPELCRVAEPDEFVGYDEALRYWVGGPMALHTDAATMSLTGQGSSQLVPGLSEADLRRVHYIALPTNLLVSAHPDYLMFHRLLPHSATQVAVECTWHFPKFAVAEPGFDPSFAADFWDLTNIQDFVACESVIRGMRSGGFRPGVFDIREDGVRSFQAQIAQFYLTRRWHHVIPSQLGAGLSHTAPQGDSRP
jgi:glycine betaine catabolism A